MLYMLDTNICIYLIKEQPRQVLTEFQKHNFGDIGISSITVAELQYGVKKSQQIKKNQQALNQFLLPLAVADFDQQTAAAYGNIRAALETVGTPIGALDTLIAAHALRLGATLVTNNIKEFSRVPDLVIANWVEN